jgi:hypothetical protein
MKIQDENKVEIIYIDKKRAKIKFNDYDFVATCKFLELNEEGVFRYCRWSVKQKDWTKGMIVWCSDTHQTEDSEAALGQAIDRMIKSKFQVQGRL